MPYSNPEKQKEAKRSWARKQRAEAQVLKALSQSLSTDEQIKIKKLLDAGKPQEARSLIGFLHNQAQERKQFELHEFKRELMQKYVCSDPKYSKLTQEGQHYYEQSFLAFLDFLEKTRRLDLLLRRKEDSEIFEKLDVFHTHQAKEIMAELDKFLKKQRVEVEKADST